MHEVPKTSWGRPSIAQGAAAEAASPEVEGVGQRPATGAPRARDQPSASPASSAALPPAAAVLTVSVCSAQKRGR